MFCSYQKQKWGIFYTILSKLHLKKTVNRSIEHTHLQMNKKELLLLKNCSVLRRMYFLWYFFSSLLYKFHKRFLFFISCAVFIKLSRCTSPSICTIQCIHGVYDDWCYPFYIASFAQFFFCRLQFINKLQTVRSANRYLHHIVLCISRAN